MTIRYKELKYNGLVYNKRYEIDKFLLENNFGWMIDAEIENMRLEIMKETLIVNAGIIYNCEFDYGVIRDCDVRNIHFVNGVINNGTFKNFLIEKGIIFGGTFLKGDIKFADIRGGDFMPGVIIHKKQNEINVQEEDKIVEPQTINDSFKYLKKFNRF
ncbi:hypothetical protein M0Q50_01180 [bacterium]|jgi:hypothetical protein|nr:hypothetical protein [bacterium]